MKVSEPEPNQKAKKSKKSIGMEKAPKIPNWARPNGAGGIGTKMNGSSGSKTIVIKAPPKTQNVRTINDAIPMPTSSYVPSSTAGSNLGNVIGFKDLNGASSGKFN